MRTSRWVLLLIMVGTTIALQGVLLYRQKGAAVEQREPVRDPPSGAVLNLEGLPVKGANTARVVVVEFSDYECPFCARHATTVSKDVDTQFVSTGKIRYAFANNPLDIHKNAIMFATAAICAGGQDRYWEMHDGLFAKPPKDKLQMLELAQTLGIDMVSFEQCLDQSPDPKARIEKDQQAAGKLSLLGTPAFAVGVTNKQGHVEVRKLITGAFPIDVFERTILAVLAEGQAP
jgi:protein-disulfide isomerase